jgi:hypothetical protein
MKANFPMLRPRLSSNGRFFPRDSRGRTEPEPDNQAGESRGEMLASRSAKYRTDVAKTLSRGVRAENGCLEWPGHMNAGGYGMVRAVLTDGTVKQMQAHQLAYEHAKGEIPDGLIVRHRCHNPKCIDPEHLVLGTRADNARDRDERFRDERMARARAIWEAKDAERAAIRRARAERAAATRKRRKKWAVIIDGVLQMPPD